MSNSLQLLSLGSRRHCRFSIRCQSVLSYCCHTVISTCIEAGSTGRGVTVTQPSLPVFLYQMGLVAMYHFMRQYLSVSPQHLIWWAIIYWKIYNIVCKAGPTLYQHWVNVFAGMCYSALRINIPQINIIERDSTWIIWTLNWIKNNFTTLNKLLLI